MLNIRANKGRLEMAKPKDESRDTVGDWRKRGLWTQDQLAESLGLSRDTVDEWKKDGMPHVKKGRFVFILQSDFLKWMKQDSKGGGEG